MSEAKDTDVENLTAFDIQCRMTWPLLSQSKEEDFAKLAQIEMQLSSHRAFRGQPGKSKFKNIHIYLHG